MKRFFSSTKKELVFLLLWVFALTVLYSTLSILRHNHFESGAFDLGLYDQAVWRYAHFLSPYNTVKERMILGDHLTLTLPLLAPLFYLWDNVRILLIAQAFFISLSSIPIFLIAKKRLKSLIATGTVMILYSLFYGIQYGIYFDFHPIIFGVGLLAWTAWALETSHKKTFWIFLILSLFTQENMGIAIVGLGFLYIVRKDYTKQAIAMIIIGILWSAIASKIIAVLSPVGFQYMPEIPNSIQTVVTRLFDSEEKKLVWLYSYSWFSFFPLLSPGSLLAVLLDLSQYFVTGPEFSRMWSPFMHHRAILSIFLTLGLVDVLSFFSKRKRTLFGVSCFLFIVFCLCQYQFHFALNKLVKADYWKEEPWMEDMRTLLTMIPKDSSVATQQNLVPHITHRKEIYLVWPRLHDIESYPCGQSLCWWLDWGGAPEYLLVDTRPNQLLTQILESNENWQSVIRNMEIDGRITLVQQVGDAKLFSIHSQ